MIDREGGESAVEASRLPQVPGGWEERDVAVGTHSFRLLLPADPYAFLSDVETLAGRPQDDDYVPYWPHLWPAAIHLAETVLAAEWKPRTPTLEVGCGVGLVGVAALSAGLDVTFSDYEPTALEVAQHNARLNGFGSARSMILDWRKPPAESFPLILASEVVYEVRHHEPLLNLLDAMLADEGCCWIADAGRQVAAEFFKLAQQRGYAAELRDEHGERLLVPCVGRFQLIALRRK